MDTKRIGTEQTLTSIEVAGMVEKEHKNLIRDIKRYTKQIEEGSSEADGRAGRKIEPGDFWSESTYEDANGQSRPCYLITKKGCEFIAHKVTGARGTRFTALYINRFHEMEDALMEQAGEYPSTHDFVDAMSRQTKIISNLVDRVEKLEQGKGYARLLPAGDNDRSAHNEIAKRAEYLGELVGNVAMLAGYSKNIIFRAMYEKLEMEFGISLDTYLYVARNEYRSDACTLHAVVMWDRLYERAVQINQEEIAKRKVYS